MENKLKKLFDDTKDRLKSVNSKKVVIIMLFFVLCYFFGGGIAILTSAFDKTGIIKENQNWGLGFSEEGRPPTGNATVEELKKYDAYYLGDVNEKTIYLTFDAGYENGYTPAILDALKKHEVPATFFLVANYIKKSPDLVNRMVEEGHIVGNHTYSHPNMANISSMEAFKKELEDLEKEYEQVTGSKMKKYYRPPQGIYSEKNLQMAQELGYKTFFWSLAYVDWYDDNQPSREEALSKLNGRIHPGAVVLLHSTSRTNSEILDELLGTWKEMGYTFGTLDEIVE